jgi:hypothetical protein
MGFVWMWFSILTEESKKSILSQWGATIHAILICNVSHRGAMLIRKYAIRVASSSWLLQIGREIVAISLHFPAGCGTSLVSSARRERSTQLNNEQMVSMLLSHEPHTLSAVSTLSQNQSHFTTGGLPPISCSWCHAPNGSRQEGFPFLNWTLAVVVLM